MTDEAVNGKATSFTLNSATGTTFPANTNVRFRVTAKNTIGYGPSSPTVTVLTDGPPTRMNTPTANSISPSQASLRWNPITSLADTGRDPVTYYKVEFLDRPCYSDLSLSCLDPSVNTWVEITNEA